MHKPTLAAVVRSARARGIVTRGGTIALVAALLLGPRPAVAQDLAPRYTTAAVVVCDRPARGGASIERLPRASRVRVVAEQGAWTQIELPDDGRLGWVATRDLATTPPRLSDAEVRRILVRTSIDAYYGNCPCPYFVDRAGRACGRRSAWSREGGEAPYCYPQDVPAEAVAAWRAEHEDVTPAEAPAPPQDDRRSSP